MTPGHLYIIAAPSGTGKTTLVKTLIDTMQHITVSISYTTRSMRDNEQDGVNYHFISEPHFHEMIAKNDFLEYATIFDHFYGTSKSWVENTLAQGIDVILEIDWQGQQQIKQLFPNVTSIFILPPSPQALLARLTHRNQDSDAIIQKRLADAALTVSHAHEFDYLIVNDDFDHALLDLKTIIKATRLSKEQQLFRLQTLIQGFKA